MRTTLVRDNAAATGKRLKSVNSRLSRPSRRFAGRRQGEASEIRQDRAHAPDLPLGALFRRVQDIIVYVL